MRHYKAPDNSVHVLDDESFEHLLPAGSVPITQAEADALRAPPPELPGRAQFRLLQGNLLTVLGKVVQRANRMKDPALARWAVQSAADVEALTTFAARLGAVTDGNVFMATVMAQYTADRAKYPAELHAAFADIAAGAAP